MLMRWSAIKFRGRFDFQVGAGKWNRLCKLRLAGLICLLGFR